MFNFAIILEVQEVDVGQHLENTKETTNECVKIQMDTGFQVDLMFTSWLTPF